MNPAVEILQTKSPMDRVEFLDLLVARFGEERGNRIMLDSLWDGLIEVKYDGSIMLPAPESEREENPIVAILRKESPLPREEVARRMGLSPNSGRFLTIVHHTLHSTEPVHEDEFKRLCTVQPVPESERSTQWQIEGMDALLKARRLGVIDQDEAGKFSFTDLRGSGLLTERELRAAGDCMRDANNYESEALDGIMRARRQLRRGSTDAQTR